MDNYHGETWGEYRDRKVDEYSTELDDIKKQIQRSMPTWLYHMLMFLAKVFIFVTDSPPFKLLAFIASLPYSIIGTIHNTLTKPQ